MASVKENQVHTGVNHFWLCLCIQIKDKDSEREKFGIGVGDQQDIKTSIRDEITDHSRIGKVGGKCYLNKNIYICACDEEVCPFCLPNNFDTSYQSLD